MKKIIYDSHMHTPLSRHATGWPVDYAKEAIKKNFKGIIFTDHAPVKEFPWVSDRWSIPERIFSEYFSLINFTKEYIGDALDIRLGLEVDFIPNNEDVDYLKKIVSLASYDYIIGSVHPGKQYLWDKYFTGGSAIDIQKKYYNYLTQGALSGLFDCIAHPDIIKTDLINHGFSINECQIGKLENEIEEFLNAVKEKDMCIEVNTQGLRKGPFEVYPNDFILKMAYKKNIPVTLGSDSHSIDKIGANFKEAYEKLLEIGYKEVSYYIERKRYSYNINDAVKFV